MKLFKLFIKDKNLSPYCKKNMVLIKLKQVYECTCKNNGCDN